MRRFVKNQDCCVSSAMLYHLLLINWRLQLQGRAWLILLRRPASQAVQYPEAAHQ